jgi:hypothetical protein
MSEHGRELLALLHRVRARWRVSVALRAWSKAASVAALVLSGALLLDRVIDPAAPGLIALWSLALVGSAACAGRLLTPVFRRPADHRVARYVEERCPEMEDTLATAVAHARGGHDSPMAAAVAADAVRRVRALDLNRVIGGDLLRRAAAIAGAATLFVVATAVLSIGPVSRAVQAFTAYAFPHGVSLQVAPGNVRMRAGSSLQIVARLPGGRDVIVPALRVHDGSGWRTTAMEPASGGFTASFDDVQRGFAYEVTAAGATSARYNVSVLHPPHVERIDVRYEYPAGFGMEPRVEEDGGDIYGPAGTRVRLAIRTDKPVDRGALTLDGGQHVPLTRDDTGALLTGALTIAADGSYRVALTDRDGLANPGDTQYFIRTLHDSPPDVHIVRPAGDRPVTPIEEVPVEAKASDDYGIAAFDLIVSVRGGEERTVPFSRRNEPWADFSTSGGSEKSAQGSVAGHTIIYLEDLGVRPGDFVTFYARARDISRGKRSSEAKSDMFFLEVKPFEEEFVSAPSGGNGAGAQGDDGSLEALIAAQKDVITATWRLDRRHRESGARSDEDIRAVARAQADVRRRAAGASSGNPQRRGGPSSPRAEGVRRQLGAQQNRPAEADQADAPLLKAVAAMEQARAQLDGLSTAKALPHEMTALNELLRAQAEIRRRQVQRQEASNSNGGGSNRQGQDLSTLFDRELARQQTNYETPTTAETREQNPVGGDDALEKIRDLARRQEALNREQQELAKNGDGLSEQDLRRRLERLTRDQSDLRQQAEDLSQQLQRDQKERRSNQSEAGQAGRALQQASEEMKNAASGLRRQDQGEASASGQRALDRLRESEKTAAAGSPQNGRGGRGSAAAHDDQRRQIGELQLESRQLADAQRRLGREGQQPSSNVPDASRRRAAEQGRLADRMQRLESSVKQLAGDRPAGRGDGDRDGQAAALDRAARELASEKLADRMKSAARAEASGQRPQREAQDIARALDRLGDRLGSAAAGESAAERESSELARARCGSSSSRSIASCPSCNETPHDQVRPGVRAGRGNPMAVPAATDPREGRRVRQTRRAAPGNVRVSSSIGSVVRRTSATGRRTATGSTRGCRRRARRRSSRTSRSGNS